MGEPKKKGGGEKRAWKLKGGAKIREKGQIRVRKGAGVPKKEKGEK